jgi:putative sigma-54 modulation protein
VQINISTRHGHISDETQAKIIEKLEKLPRLYDRMNAIEVTVDLERRDLPSVDLRISAKQHEFVAASQRGELLASIDEVVEKMEQQLRKHKDKVQDRHRGPSHRS